MQAKVLITPPSSFPLLHERLAPQHSKESNLAQYPRWNYGIITRVTLLSRCVHLRWVCYTLYYLRCVTPTKYKDRQATWWGWHTYCLPSCISLARITYIHLLCIALLIKHNSAKDIHTVRNESRVERSETRRRRCTQLQMWGSCVQNSFDDICMTCHLWYVVREC
jgi:hypothetical protein